MIPDIGVFGPFTYLVTEVMFGGIAMILLWYTGAWRRAAITVAALYPVGYVWDWYTLEVGVFAIPLRTGVDVLGIPIEEHLFMIVVPAVVIGTHEAIHGELMGELATSRGADTEEDDDATADGDGTDEDRRLVGANR